MRDLFKLYFDLFQNEKKILTNHQTNVEKIMTIQIIREFDEMRFHDSIRRIFEIYC